MVPANARMSATVIRVGDQTMLGSPWERQSPLHREGGRDGGRHERASWLNCLDGAVREVLYA